MRKVGLIDISVRFIQLKVTGSGLSFDQYNFTRIRDGLSGFTVVGPDPGVGSKQDPLFRF